MTFGLEAANYTLSGLRPFPVAVTTVHDGRANGLADVVGAERLREGERLRIGPAWEKLANEWIEQYEANHVPQLESARRNRGLIE
jgi:hypothetical protein